LTVKDWRDLGEVTLYTQFILQTVLFRIDPVVMFIILLMINKFEINDKRIQTNLLRRQYQYSQNS